MKERSVDVQKLLLFPLVFAVCGGFVNVAIAESEEDYFCTGTTCAYIPSGGVSEGNLCYREGNINGEAAPDPAVWDYVGFGFYQKKIGQDCTSGKIGAKVAKCVGGEGDRSCAAYECQDGYLLQTTNTRKEISVVNRELKGDTKIPDSVASQGRCVSEDKLNTNLCQKGCGCKNDEKCVLNKFTVSNHGKDVLAFLQQHVCVCVRKEKIDNDVMPQPDDCKECDFAFKVDVYCKKPLRKISAEKTIKITKEEADSPDWAKLRKKLEDIEKDAVIEDVLATFSKDNNIDKKKIEEFVKKICNVGQVINSVPVSLPVDDNGAEIESAKKTLANFYKKTKDNRNVWRDKDGNFNTARLASDLTAGVVLGTVGGVVSGVVIKKKQVEKGFDALHCTVGGQTVADWGDTFTVGLR